MSGIEASVFDVDVDCFVDQVSMLTSSKEFPNDAVIVWPHGATFIRPLPSIGGLRKCEIWGGGSVLGLANGSGFEGRVNGDVNCVISGDCSWPCESGLRDGVYSQGVCKIEGPASLAGER